MTPPLEILPNSKCNGKNTRIIILIHSIKDIWVAYFSHICFSLAVQFYVFTVTKEDSVLESGMDVVENLKRKLRANADVVDFKVLQLDTVSK